MKMRVLCIGKRMPSWVDDGVEAFMKRFPRQFPVEMEVIDPAPRKSGQTMAQLQAADSARLQNRLRPGERLVALDERGQPGTSPDFARRIETWQMDGRDVSLVIGGADGHSAEFRQRADELLSLSRMTLPHGLARLLLIEQVYRAYTLMSGHPYHRE